MFAISVFVSYACSRGEFKGGKMNPSILVCRFRRSVSSYKICSPIRVATSALSLFAVLAAGSRSEAAPLVVIEPSAQLQLEKAQTPEQSARGFLKIYAGALGLRSDLSDLELESVTKTPMGYSVRFQQTHAGLPVDGATLVVSLSQDLTPVTYINEAVAVSQTSGLNEGLFSPFKLPKQEAVLRAYDFLKLTASPVKEEVLLKKRFENGQMRSVYQVTVSAPIDGRYAWEVFLDAETGEVIRSRNLILNQRARAGVAATVFDPNPTIKSGKAMGTVAGYTDANNADSPFFQSMLTPVVLDNLLTSGGKTVLAGPNVVISDSEAPKNPDCSVKSRNFSLKRSDPCFDAVSVYYFIDKQLRYINGRLGFNMRPIKYQGGVKVDPHGVNGEDNSHYSPFSDELAFGEGGVDDAQDHDVIIHELGHAMHNWVTKGHISQVQGLSEGTGDYAAASYGRPFMKAGHVAYHWTFSFDGHNQFWPGRVTNIAQKYPAGAQGSIHSAGQLWATVCMEIFDAIGKEKADKLFWSAMSMLNERSNQADAAQAYVVAASKLFPADLATVVAKFQARGYPVKAIR
jgi:hypothetical protein